MAHKLPLPSDFFKCPPLTKEQREKFLSMGIQSVQNLIRKADLDGGDFKWTALSNELDLKIYKGEGIRKSLLYDIHCGVMETVGSLDELMSLYRSDSTSQAKEYVRRFGRAFVDVNTLYTILPRSPNKPNDCIQIKWFVAKSPFGGLVSKRDFCLLESDLELQLENGKRAWVRAYKSVELDCVPDMKQLLNVIRGYQYDMGHVFIEADRPGYLHMTYLADMDVMGTVPDWANGKAIKHWCRSLSDIDHFLREDRLARTPFLHQNQLCPQDIRSRCYLCHRHFGSLRKKSNCFKCGEVVCSRCNPLWKLKVNGIPLQINACLPCSLNSTHVSSRICYSTDSTIDPLAKHVPHEWGMETSYDNMSLKSDNSSHPSSYYDNESSAADVGWTTTCQDLSPGQSPIMLE